MQPHFRTRCKIMALSVAGRSPLCSFTRAVHEYGRHLDMSTAANRISEACRILESDPVGINLWATPGGELWAPESTGSYGLAMMIAEQEVGAYGNGASFCKPGDIVLDCGANIGLFSRTAIRIGARQVVAVEPFPLSVECLRRNLAKEISQGQLSIYEKGLWDDKTSLPFIIDPQNAGGNSFITTNENSYSGPSLAVTTIDCMISELGLQRVDFIKMDIEAAEQRALAGAAGVLQRFRPSLAIAVEHTPDRLGNARGVVRVVQHANAGYQYECGLCYFSQDNRVLPEILYFR